MLKSNLAAYRYSRVVLLALVVTGGCSDGSAPANTPQALSIGFASDGSDVVAVLPAAEDGDATIVIMRGGGEARARHVAFVRNGDVAAEAIADDAGRLGEFTIEGHRFVFTDHTTAQVTVTHHAPDGSSDTSQLDLEEAVAMQAHALRDDEVQAQEAEVSETLIWTADLTNTYLPLIIQSKAGEKISGLFDRFRTQVDKVSKKAQKLAVVVGNGLKCLTSTRSQCAEQVAEQAPQLAAELRAVDPEAATTAGFEVNDRGIGPVRAEWDPLIIQGEISTEFTLKDVPCAESVFADMNPDCPQYVPPAMPSTEQDAGTHDSGALDLFESPARLCYQKLEDNQFRLNCKVTPLGTCEASGWTFLGTYDDVLACSSDVRTVGEQIQNGDFSLGPNSHEATGTGGVGGGGAGGSGGAGGTGGSPSVGDCIGSGKELVTIEGESMCLVREVGYAIVGTYHYEGGEPIVQLDADGGGLMQYHGCTPVPIHWGIEADANGQAIKVENERGVWFTMAYRREAQACLENGSQAHPVGWDRAQLNVLFETNTVYIYGEREKPL